MRTIKILTLLFIAAFSIAAQTERGIITGVITDPTGAAVAGAELTLVNRDTNATVRATATNSGEFSLPNLLPDSYRVDITASGFKRFVRQNIIISARIFWKIGKSEFGEDLHYSRKHQVGFPR